MFEGFLLFLFGWVVGVAVSVPFMLRWNKRRGYLPIENIPHTESELLSIIIMKGMCPDCEAEKSFVEGPRGEQNIFVLCKECYAEFDVSPSSVVRLAAQGCGRKMLYNLPLKKIRF